MGNELPKFKYHPEPLITRNIIYQKGTCNCCKKESDFKYIGPIYSIEDISYLCPACIKNGRAHRELEAEFTDLDSIQVPKNNINQSIIEEVAYRTPGFISTQDGLWLSGENDVNAFIGELDYETLIKNTDIIERIKNNSEVYDEKEWEYLMSGIKKQIVTVYGFKDLENGNITGYIDHS